jgi:heme o synthase
MPPLFGYAGASGHITWFPHFYAIAWMYREDYARGGIRMLPVMRPDGVSTARQIVICSLLLIPVSPIPSYLHMTTVIYFVSAAVLAVAFVYFSLQVVYMRTTRSARHVLLASVTYLPALLSVMLYDHVSRR